MTGSKSVAITHEPKRSVSCGERLLSVKVLLPTTVALIVLIMAATSIALFAVNTDSAVAGVVERLHDQVQGLVESRVHAHLDQVLSINMASARALAKRPLGPPPGNQTPVADLALAAHLDSVVTNYPLIDVHYVFYRNGRVVGALANDAATNLYAEEFYPNGLYFWAYPVGNVSAIDTNRSNPALHVADYVGYTRPYFTTQRHDVGFDYAWTNPYMVGPLLLFTNTITMIDDSGVFQGVMGADSYITTLTAFFTTLRPTQRTKVFLADPTGLLVIATHGDVLTEDGQRIAVVDARDETVAKAGRAMGDFGAIPTTTQRTTVDADGEPWFLSYKLTEVLRATLVVGVLTPEDEFLGAVRRTTRQTIGICAAVAVVGLIVIVAFCVVISSALGRLEERLDQVARLEIPDDASTASGGGQSADGRYAHSNQGSDDDDDDDSVYSRHRSKRSGGNVTLFTEIRRTNESYVKLRTAIGAFRRYVPRTVVSGLLSGRIQPYTAMNPAQVAVAFQDIAGFTSMCETYSATVVVSLVSRIFEKMSGIIAAHGGTIDKYIGDAIMSFWDVDGADDAIAAHTQNGSGVAGSVDPNASTTMGASTLTSTDMGKSTTNSAARVDAVDSDMAPRFTTGSAACASCVRALILGRSLALEGPDGLTVRFRGGAHFGPALLGNFGSSTRFSYTVVGDTVNSAARLEPLNKETETRVLFSGELVDAALKADAALRDRVVYLGRVALVGKVGLTALYTATDEPIRRDDGELWAAGIGAFEAGDYATAARRFLSLSMDENLEPDVRSAARALAAQADADSKQPLDPTAKVGVRKQANK